MKVGAATLFVTAVAAGVWTVTQPTRAESPAPAAAATPSVAQAGAAKPLEVRSLEDRSSKLAAHAELLRQINAALATARPPAAPNGAPLPALPTLPRLDEDYIKAQMKEVIYPLVKECYEHALRTNPALAGTLTVGYTIVGDPSVGGLVGESHIVDAESTIADADMRECVQESMYAARFPPPRAGGEVRVEYPYTFSH